MRRLLLLALALLFTCLEARAQVAITGLDTYAGNCASGDWFVMVDVSTTTGNYAGPGGQSVKLTCSDVNSSVQALGLSADNLTSGTVPLARLSGITTTELSATAGILNAQLANSSVNFGGVSVALGASDLTPAFDLTDATGLPLTTGITGTLGIANGGTGATTAAGARTSLGLEIGVDVAAFAHAAQHSQGGADAVTAENLASACGSGAPLEGDGAGGVVCGVDATGSGGTANILDLGNDATNESTDLITFASTNDPDNIMTEPAADKLLFDFAPVILETEIDTEAEFEAKAFPVFTPSDGALDDDDLSDDLASALSDVAYPNALADGQILVRDQTTGVAFENVAVSGDATLSLSGDLQLVADAVGAAELSSTAIQSGDIEAGDLPAHASLHQDGGADEISVAALSGELADAQKTTIEKAGTLIGTRPRINFIEGSNVTLTIADDGTDDEVDVTIEATTAASGDQITVNGTSATDPDLVDGDIDFSLDTAPAPDVITASVDVATARSYTAAQTSTLATLTDQSTITWNLQTQQVARVTLGANRTLGAPTNQVAGGTYVLIIRQDATGSRTLTFNSTYEFPGGTDPTLSTGANDVDVISCLSDGTSMFCTSAADFQ